MKNLLIFIIKHHFFLLFLLFEVIAIVLVVQYNEPQKIKFESVSNTMYSQLYSATNSISQYFNLRTINEQLSQENAILRASIEDSKLSIEMHSEQVFDSVFKQQYQYIPAKILNSSISKPHNYITLNKGRRQGVEKHMAVISPQGVVGIVVSVSQNFSKVLSILSPQFKISAKFKKNNFYGSVFWQGNNYRQATLSEIPVYAEVNVGDTIVTNSFSNIYPTNILIGLVSDVYKSEHDNFYNIEITLSTDFKNLEFVYIVQNLYKDERDFLELGEKTW
ncbi:MAG TPA: rod shape-determining protein MreC [Bacteroidales bacterium]|nr:rod shape-determining protein MreC [Bacteroidales bacterium]